MKKWSAGALCAALLCAVLPVRGAEVLTGDIPPFSIKEGPRPGFVREAVKEQLKGPGSIYFAKLSHSAGRALGLTRATRCWKDREAWSYENNRARPLLLFLLLFTSLLSAP